MILLLTALRWCALVIWLSLAVRLTPDAWRALAGHRRYHDPIWALIWGLAINRVWFVSRDLWFHPEPGVVEAGALIVGYMTAALFALGLFKLRGAYGD